MANKKIQGITVEIGGNTTKLQDALKDVNDRLKDTQSNLREVDKLLKLDPKNVELLTQKQEYLTSAINDTKEKLATEKKALEQLKSSGVGDTTEQQAALTREIEKTSQQLESLERQYKDFGSVSSQVVKSVGSDISEVGGKIKDAGGNVSSVGSTLTKTVTAPIAAVAASAVASWKSVDEAMDTITTKTGATGPALTDMQERAKAIAESLPVELSDAASAIGEVNTRFGLTGDELQTVSEQFLKFSQLNGTDVSGSIDSVSQALAAFGQDASDAGNLLDALNSVGQATGVSVDTLAADLSANAAQFTAMGLSAEQAAGLIGTADMAGLDASTMLAGLTKAQKNAAADGLTLSDTLQQFSGVMQSNASDTEKLQAAYDVFGSKAGAAIANAFSSGQLSLDAMTGSLSDFSGSVDTTFAETLDPMDEMTTTLNSMKITLSELVDAAGPMITDALGTAKDVILDLKSAWDGLDDGQQQAIVKAALLAAAVGPVVTALGGAITTVGGVVDGVGKMVTAGGQLIGVAGQIAGALGPAGLVAIAVAAGVALIIANWGSISAGLSSLWENGIKPILDGIGNAFSTVAHGIGDVIAWLWDSVVKPYYQFIFDLLSSIASGIIDKVGGVIDWIKSIPQKIAAVWQQIKGLIKLPHFSIQGEFSLKPPSVPHLAVQWYRKAYDTAAAFTSPTILATNNGLAGVGDGSGAEFVVGQSLLAETIKSALQTAGTGSQGITVNVYPSAGMDERALADYTIDRLNSQLQISQAAFK